MSCLEVDIELTKECRCWSDTLRTHGPRRVPKFFIFGIWQRQRIWHASARERNGHLECVAYNPDENKNAFNQWRKSPPHWSIMTKRNIKKIGVGRSGGYWTLRVRE
ncbi:MAG: CAP domain-containing protein [Planctomycetaceae bacterium]|nr:CAP domain-containing protein [Planctomycetaceae bacterium]